MADLYTINPADNFRRGSLIEEFESCIWTDRYADIGDLTLIARPTADNLARLVPGAYIGFDQTKNVMIVENAYRTEDDDGKRAIKVEGRSIIKILEDRVARIVLNNTTWNVSGDPGGIVTGVVWAVCGNGTGVLPADDIPNLTTSNYTPSGPSITLEIKLGTVYERIKEICDTYDYGFRMETIQPNSSALNFAVYSGTDRTAAWGVEFSSDLENLSGTSYLKSKAGYKNVAYVISANGSRVVNATGGASSSGFGRQVLVVDATDITLPAGTPLQVALLQRGQQALSEHRAATLFDGTVNSNYPYQFNKDFFLGDLVPLVADDGVRQVMRVTEHIWSLDSEGYKSYPTLSVPGGV